MTAPSSLTGPPLTPAPPDPVSAVHGPHSPAGPSESSPLEQRARMAPAALAIASFLVLVALVLSHPYKMREPDPYAYRASMAALEDGRITLGQDEYQQLQSELAGVDDGWSSGTGIMQWIRTDDGRYVSEKNPGYPFLAVAFDALGMIRLAPLFYGALACLALWFGARRWLGPWGGALAVGLFCSASAVLIMAYEAYMPSFTDTALAAAGGGALIWAVLADDRSWRRRAGVGAMAFLAAGLAVFVRYTNITVLAVFAVAAVVAALSRRRGLGWKVLPLWGSAAAIPLAVVVIYNKATYGRFVSTGYSSQGVSFSVSALGGNLHQLPGRLLYAMPAYVLAALALVVAAVGLIFEALRRHTSLQSGADPSSVGRPMTPDDPASGPATTSDALAVDAESATADGPSPSMWVIAVLGAWWLAIWGVYAFYDWTARGFPSGAPGGGTGTGGPGGGASFMVLTRFYLPAMGAIALLGAWLLSRFPRAVGAAALAGLFVFGAYYYHQGATGDFVYGSSDVQPGFGGGRGGASRGASTSGPRPTAGSSARTPV